MYAITVSVDPSWYGPGCCISLNLTTCFDVISGSGRGTDGVAGGRECRTCGEPLGYEYHNDKPNGRARLARQALLLLKVTGISASKTPPASHCRLLLLWKRLYVRKMDHSLAKLLDYALPQLLHWGDLQSLFRFQRYLGGPSGPFEDFSGVCGTVSAASGAIFGACCGILGSGTIFGVSWDVLGDSWTLLEASCGPLGGSLCVLVWGPPGVIFGLPLRRSWGHTEASWAHRNHERRAPEERLNNIMCFCVCVCVFASRVPPWETLGLQWSHLMACGGHAGGILGQHVPSRRHL